MEIGTLTGQIKLEDQMSAVLLKVDALLNKVGGSSTTSMGMMEQAMKRSALMGSFLGNTLSDLAMKAITFGTNIVKSSVQAGLRLEQLTVSTRFLGERSGYTAGAVDDIAKKIQGQGISAISTRESITQLLGANIKLEHGSKLAAIAQSMQSISGRSSSETFQALTRAIATGNTMILRNIGFQNISMLGMQQSAKAAGTYTGQMTGTARTQAVLNAVLKEGERYLGLYGRVMETAGKQASSSERAWSEVAETIGTMILPITSLAIKSWYQLGTTVRDKAMEALPAVTVFVQVIADGLTAVINSVKGFYASVENAFSGSGVAIAGFADRVVPMLTNFSDRVMPVFAKAWNAVRVAIVDALAVVKTWDLSWIMDGLKALGAILWDAAERIMPIFVRAWNAAKNIVAEAYKVMAGWDWHALGEIALWVAEVALEALIQAFNASVTVVEKAVEWWQKAPPWLKAVGEAAAIGAIGLWAFRDSTLAAYTLWTGKLLVNGILAGAAAIKVLAAATLSNGLTGFVAVIKGWGSALLALTIGPAAPFIATIAAIAAVGAAIYLLIHHWDDLKRIMSTAFAVLEGPIEFLKREFKNITDWLKEVGVQVMALDDMFKDPSWNKESAHSGWKNALEGLKSDLQQIIDGIRWLDNWFKAPKSEPQLGKALAGALKWIDQAIKPPNLAQQNLWNKLSQPISVDTIKPLQHPSGVATTVPSVMTTTLGAATLGSIVPGAAAPPPIVPNKPGAEPAQLDEYGKKVASLFKTWTEGSKDIRAVEDAFKKLTPVQLANYDVLARIAPEILKVAEAHRGQLSPAMQKALADYQREHEALVTRGMHLLESKNVTLDVIKYQKEMGQSEAEIAQGYGTTVEILQHYMGVQGKVAAHAAEQAELRQRESTRAIEFTQARNTALIALEKEYTDFTVEQTGTRMEAQIRAADAWKAGEKAKYSHFELVEGEITSKIEQQYQLRIDMALGLKAVEMSLYDWRRTQRMTDLQRELDAIEQAENARMDELETARRLTDENIKLTQQQFNVIRLERLGAMDIDRLYYSEVKKNSKESLAKQIEDIKLWGIAVAEIYRALGLLTDEMWTKIQKIVEKRTNEAIDATEDWRDELQGLAGAFSDLAQIADGSFSDIVKGIGQIIGIMNVAAQAGKTMMEGLEKGVGGWAQALTGAMSGIGAIMGAGASGNPLMGAIGGAMGGESFMTSGLGKMLGLGAMAGPVGMIAGAGLGLISSFFNRGPTEYEKNARAAGEEFDNLTKEINKTYSSTAKLEAAAKTVGLTFHEAMLTRDPNGDDVFSKRDELKAFYDELQERTERLNDAMDRYALTWKDLGQAAKEAHISEIATGLVEDFEVLAAAGVAPETAIKKMSKALNQYVIDSARAGVAIPASMQPILEQLIKTGQMSSAAANALVLAPPPGALDTAKARLKEVTDTIATFYETSAKQWAETGNAAMAGQANVIALNWQGLDVPKNTEEWEKYKKAVEDWDAAIEDGGDELYALKLEARSAGQVVYELAQKGYDGAKEGTREWEIYQQAVADWESAVAAAGSETQNLTDAQQEQLSALVREYEDLNGEIADYEDAMAQLGEDIPTYEELKEAAERYGITMEDLGGKAMQLQITDIAEQMVKDWDIMGRATGNYGAMINGMQDEVQDLVDDAIKYQAELPAAMKPMIQSFIDAGALVDENGEKLTDLSQLKWAIPLEEMFETLIAKLDLFIDRIAGPDGVAGALTGLGKVNVPTIQIPYEYVPENLPNKAEGESGYYQAAGGVVYAAQGAVITTPVYAERGMLLPFEPRGTDTVPAMLTPGERVLSVEENREYEQTVPRIKWPAIEKVFLSLADWYGEFLTKMNHVGGALTAFSTTSVPTFTLPELNQELPGHVIYAAPQFSAQRPSYAPVYAAQGVVVPFRPRDPDVTPNERVLTVRENIEYERRERGGGTVVVELDGRWMAETTVPEMARVKKRLRLGR